MAQCLRARKVWVAKCSLLFQINAKVHAENKLGATFISIIALFANHCGGFSLIFVEGLRCRDKLNLRPQMDTCRS